MSEAYYNGRRIDDMTREELIIIIEKAAIEIGHLREENLNLSRKLRHELLRQGGYE